jgi:hypothetical protein
MIKNHVTSLELSKKLKELGVKQESEFYWAEEKTGGWNQQDWHTVLTDDFYEGDYNEFRNKISAFLSSELGEMIKDLPGEKEAHTEWNYIYKKWICYLIDRNMDPEHEEEDESESNARAKILIHIIENNLVDVKSL